MIIRAGFLLLILTYVKTTNSFNDAKDSAHELNYEQSRSQNMKFSKRDSVLEPAVDNKNDNKKKDAPENPKSEASPNTIGANEGGGASLVLGQLGTNTSDSGTNKIDSKLEDHNAQNITLNNSTANTLNINETSTISKQNATVNTTSTDIGSALKDPGVVKRGLIVFGGFALLAVAYFIFYRRKSKKYDANSLHSTNDNNQFRYGVLQSDDRRDNLELSRIPLTMESDEDDEEDLEIFDLEQKKKSLSYVNLQTNDEDIVLNSSKDESKNNLLLDIEDGPSDTLINWSNTGNNNSIL